MKKQLTLMADRQLGTPAKHKQNGSWVQTERKAHEAWAGLIARKPRAAEVLHHLVAQMGHQNAVVISQALLAKLMGRSIDTVARAIEVLRNERWIEVVRIGKGREAAYRVNDQVAWGERRDMLHLSTFSATVVADIEDQDALTLEHKDLRRIPTLYPGERQLPTGLGEPPPSQQLIDGTEPDLPALSADAEHRAALEKRGQQRLLADDAASTSSEASARAPARRTPRSKTR